MSLRRDLEASLAATPVTMASIAQQTIDAVSRDTRLRKTARFAADAARFAKEGKEADCRRALEKAARALLEIPEQP